MRFFSKSSFSDDTWFFCYMCCGIGPHARNATSCFRRVEQGQLSTSEALWEAFYRMIEVEKAF